jgi:hypothetical protein
MSSKQIAGSDMMAQFAAFQQFLALQSGVAVVPNVGAPTNGKGKSSKGKVTQLPAAGAVSDVSAAVDASGMILVELDTPSALGKPTKNGKRRVIAGSGYAGTLLGDVLGRKGVRIFVTMTAAV